MRTKHTNKLFLTILFLALALTLAACGSKKAADPDKRTIVQNGDLISVDFTGYIDGKTFEGGGTGGFGTELKIGSGEFIPGFEEALIGHEIGENFEITVAFPETYHNKTLAGKEAVFKVKILDILE